MATSAHSPAYHAMACVLPLAAAARSGLTPSRATSRPTNNVRVHACSSSTTPARVNNVNVVHGYVIPGGGFTKSVRSTSSSSSRRTSTSPTTTTTAVAARRQQQQRRGGLAVVCASSNGSNGGGGDGDQFRRWLLETELPKSGKVVAKRLSSLPLAIGEMLVIAGFSALGTVIEQNKGAAWWAPPVQAESSVPIARKRLVSFNPEM